MREELGLDVEPEEVDRALLEFEQALHRREALVVVTSRRGLAHSSLVRTALARFEDAFLVVMVSAASAEPIDAIDRLLENSAEENEGLSNDEKHAALTRVATQAGELGRPILVVVEDAELASIQQLERLRTTLQIDQGPVRAIQLVLVGSHKLLQKLKKRDARGIWTRVTTHVDVPADAPSARATTGREDAVADAPEGRRRSPLVAISSAVVLVAVLLLIASLSRREEHDGTAQIAHVTVQPARSVEAVAANPIAGAAGTQQAGTSGSAQGPQSDAPAANLPALGAGASGTVAPSGPTEATASPAAPEPASQSGPKVSEWMGVETVRGTVPRKSDASAPTEATENDAVHGEAHPGPPAGLPPQAGLPKPGARVVSVDASGSTTSAPLLAATPPAEAVSQTAVTPMAEASSKPAVTQEATSSAATPSAAVAPSPAAPPSPTVAPPAASAATETAAVEKASVSPGRTPVRAAAIAGIELQVASLSTAAKAESLKKALVSDFPAVRVDEAVVAGKSYYRVRVGPFATSAVATHAEERLRAMGHSPVRYGSARRPG